MNERVSERLRKMYRANGNKMVVTELRGNEHEVYLLKWDVMNCSNIVWNRW